MTDWDKRFLDLAAYIGCWSKETGRKVGAVVVGPDREIRATGFNGFPRGVNDDIAERHDGASGQKYIWSCHAEENAICNAARVGVSLKGCTIYIPWYPCVPCAKSIIQSGISELVAYQPDLTDPKWGNDFKTAGIMLAEAGIKVRFLSARS